MKLLMLCAALSAAGGGCSSALRGPDTCTEIHFDATYVLARWAGWTADDARAIAAADAWTDEHARTNSVATERRILGGLASPLTIPWVLFSSAGAILTEGEAPGRAFGKSAAEATSWAVPSLGLRLHFPAREGHEPVTPAFFSNPATGEIEYGNAEARRVLEAAFLAFQSHDPDRDASLALLGIGLHTVQDSIKHSGYTAVCGHIGARPDPDCACGNLDAALLGARVTLNALRYARRLEAGASLPPPASWIRTLRLGFLDAAASPGSSQERWAQLIRREFPDDYPSRATSLERWRAAGGERIFERALIQVEEVLR
ncbi:MAG: hypothetical protein HY293_01800 [Planctomycetes bacterium]|nr:hypothetical protein [Planctomycetota bacterium]